MTIESHIDTTVKAVAVGGSGVLGFGWAAQVDWIAATGAAVLVLTFITNLIFRAKKERREQEKHDLEIQIMKEKGGA